MDTVFYDSLKRNGVILEGHFKLTSGRHSKLYVNKDGIYCDPTLFENVINIMTLKLNQEEFMIDVDVITGPAIAGAVLAAPIAINFMRQFVYPEKFDKKMIFRRGYEKVIPGKKVLIVEDIITTGSSVQKTADAIKELDGEVIGLISIWNRTGWFLEGAKNITLIDKLIESWEPKDCPICNRQEKWIDLQDPKQKNIE